MAAGSKNPDLIDYIDDDTQNEDETLFFPAPSDGFPDAWSGFFGGLLIGLAGGALVPIAPWLGGLLIFAGYLLAGLTLRRGRSRFSRALSFGFGILAVAGAALLFGQFLAADTASSLVAAAARQHMIFLSVAALPWLIGIVKYIFMVMTGKPSARRGSRAVA